VGVRRRLSFKRLITAAALVAVLCLALFLTRTLWLTALGSALVYDQGPAKADIAVVLAGDDWGFRIVKGAEMVRQGYVPAVLVSGPPGFYGFHESDLAIQFAVRKGYPAEWFIPLPHETFSTRDEAGVILTELRRRNIHSFLLVTSNFHTRRATRIYRSAERGMADAPSFRTVAATHPFFSPDAWWRNREGRKIFFFEWVKTVTGVLGI
jgi:uncharacterized SAM-binding protein YcdF (DUF218 family)